jgi:hypothetical protein
MSESHEERADRVERELDDMERESDELGDRIEDARKDWERKKADPSVPGADEPQEEDDREKPPPEADFPAGR